MKIFILSAIFICQIIGCTSGNNNHGDYYLKIRDDLNREIILNKKPARIISLAPSITEILFSIDSGKTLIGVTDFCDFPREAMAKASVGGMINPNHEKIADLKPDLILMTIEGNNQNDFNKLLKTGYAVFVINPKSIENIYSSILNLGKIIGAELQASEKVKRMRENQVEILKNKLLIKHKSALVIISVQPLICAGAGIFIDEMLSILGVKNISAGLNNPYPILNREYIMAKNPDIIFIMDDLVKNKNEILSLYPEWRDLKAFKNDYIEFLNPDIISRPGPRIIEGFSQIFISLK